MKCEHIDGATFTPDVERELDRTLPAGEPKPLHHRLDESGMPGVEQPIERLSIPGQPNLEARPERGRNPVQGRESKPVGLTAFRAADLRPTHSDPL